MSDPIISPRMAEENKAVKKWTHLRNSARKRNLVFDVTVAEVKKLMKRKTCYFLGTPITHYTDTDGGVLPADALTIDRVDSQQGYVSGNVVACSSRVNQAKGDLTLEELKKLVSKVEEFENGRS